MPQPEIAARHHLKHHCFRSIFGYNLSPSATDAIKWPLGTVTNGKLGNDFLNQSEDSTDEVNGPTSAPLIWGRIASAAALIAGLAFFMLGSFFCWLLTGPMAPGSVLGYLFLCAAPLWLSIVLIHGWIFHNRNGEVDLPPISSKYFALGNALVFGALYLAINWIVAKAGWSLLLFPVVLLGLAFRMVFVEAWKGLSNKKSDNQE